MDVLRGCRDHIALDLRGNRAENVRALRPRPARWLARFFVSHAAENERHCRGQNPSFARARDVLPRRVLARAFYNLASAVARRRSSFMAIRRSRAAFGMGAHGARGGVAPSCRRGEIELEVRLFRGARGIFCASSGRCAWRNEHGARRFDRKLGSSRRADNPVAHSRLLARLFVATPVERAFART